MKRRYHIVVDGRVQGVGFRYFVIIQANKYSLTGTVHNMSNGMVEIFVQGEKQQIKSFIAVIQTGNRFIQVTDLRMKEMELKEDEREFKCVDYL